MKACITPSKCSGHVIIPPSKSMAHRAIICAALAKGHSVIKNIAYSKDIQATISGMQQLGADITMDKDSLTITGIQDMSALRQQEIFCGESGSTLRFFIPIFSLCDQRVTFTGQGRLMQRPQKVYEDIFHSQGLIFQQNEQGITIEGRLHPGDITLQGNVSSQFISGLLFTLPLLDQDSRIHILPPFESKSYVVLTLQMLEVFGIHAYFEDALTLCIPGNQTYQAAHYSVEGDFSQLAFFAVLAAIHGDITISGIHHASQQGDKKIISILQEFGACIEEVENGYHIVQRPLHGCSCDLADCPDLGPVLTVLAMYAEGETKIYHAERLRIKESDRIAAMEQELRKFKVHIHSTADEIFIIGKRSYSCLETLHGHNDHRIVMALTVAALCSDTTCTIEDAQAIAKSYPSFFEDVQSIGGKVELL